MNIFNNKSINEQFEELHNWYLKKCKELISQTDDLDDICEIYRVIGKELNYLPDELPKEILAELDNFERYETIQFDDLDNWFDSEELRQLMREFFIKYELKSFVYNW